MVIGAVVPVADGTTPAAHRADHFMPDVAIQRITFAHMVSAGPHRGDVTRALHAMADVTDAVACLAALFITGGAARDAFCRSIAPPAQTHTLAADNAPTRHCAIEAGSYGAVAFGAGDETVLAKALTAQAACADPGAVLPATRTTHGTGAADQHCLAILAQHGIGAQVAATLADAAFGAFFLTGETDFILADGTLAQMLQTGAFAARATLLAALIAIILCAHWTLRHATIGAKYIPTLLALSLACITDDMPVAAKHDIVQVIAA
jgi:hypothetical protein